MNKTESLKQILHFGINREEAYSVLLSYPIGDENSLVVASKQLLAEVLQMNLDNKISFDDLEEWATFIECRDDINYTQIEDFVYALANPELMGSIDKEKITKMIDLLHIK